MRLSRHAQTLGSVQTRLSQRLSRHPRFSGRSGRVSCIVSPTQIGERERLSQRLSRLSRFSGKSRAADMRDRLSRPYVNRAGKSLSLGWETLPPLKGAGRVEKADNLLPFYRDEAKGRQMELAGTRPNKTDLVVKLPPPEKSKARDAAGKAAGVSGSYVDKASGGDMTKKAVPQKVAEPKNSEARDAAGKAAGANHTYVDKASDPEALADFREAVTGEPHRPKKESGYNVTSNERVTGNAKAYTLSRLKRETPELFERVKAGDPQRRSALIGWRWVQRCLRRAGGQRRAMAMAWGRALLYLETITGPFRSF